jgi:hypothetical protein|tara:strand:- start:37 stop:420 length:384 start_codon:yes stop_codon:yes gene_type:complete
METFKDIIKYLVGLAIVGIVLWVAVEWVSTINKGHGEFWRDMDGDDVVTYKDNFVRVLYPAGIVILNIVNPILDSDFGKYFEISPIDITNKATSWSGIFFYVIVLPTCISLAARFLAKIFNVDDEFE